jgi:flagellar protein FliS
MNMVNAIDAYKDTKVRTAIDDATPHQLVKLLLDGALERIALASGAMARGDIALTGEAIGKSISILDNLRVSLDHEQGGAVAANLEQLYDYMTRRLLEASVAQDAELLAEVMGLVKEVKSAWEEVPTEFHTLTAE